MLWIALYFPRLPLEQFSRLVPDSVPLAVTSGTGRGERILDANRTAAACGITPGIKPGSAYSLCRELLIRKREPGRERQALESLADCALQFSATIGLVEQGLLLEAAGSLRLFGGLEPLSQELSRTFAECGYRSNLAAAPTPAAAVLLAKAGGHIRIERMTELVGALAPIPVFHLPLDAVVRENLQALGLDTIGDCLGVPRAGLAQRMGADFADYLECLFGRKADPVPPYQPSPRFHRLLSLPAEADSLEGIHFALRRLLQELQRYLLIRAGAVDHFLLGLHYHSAPVTWLRVCSLQPGRDVDHWFWLLQQQWEKLELPQAVTELELRADQVFTASEQPLSLFGPRVEETSLAQLLDRLCARLGDGSVRGIGPTGDHRPEYSWCYRNPGETRPGAIPVKGAGLRPTWLLEQPEILSTCRGNPVYGEPLDLLEGPERIESGWWDGRDIARDYYLARHPRGSCYWIYRDCRGGRKWYLQGVFG